MTSDRLAFSRQKAAAKYRGIDWKFTFEEWEKVWSDSGHKNDRGIGSGKYVMARFLDKGPYSKENVEIIKCEKNASDARANHVRSLHDLRSKQIGTGRGWTKVGKKFQVTVSKKYVGTFDTEEEAVLAYKRSASLLLESSRRNSAWINPNTPEGERK